MVTHIARVRINRVRLPILLVVSGTGKMDVSMSPFEPREFGKYMPSTTVLINRGRTSRFSTNRLKLFIDTPPDFTRVVNVDTVCVVCVCVVIPFILDFGFVDVPARVTQEEGHTGFFIHLPSALLALIFLAMRRIQPFLSLVDRHVEFCVLTI